MYFFFSVLLLRIMINSVRKKKRDRERERERKYMNAFIGKSIKRKRLFCLENLFVFVLVLREIH
jgi:hypothetical protein